MFTAMQSATAMLRSAALGAAVLASGCVIHTRPMTTTTAYQVQGSAYAQPVYVSVSQPPPPLRAAVQVTARPHAGAVWVDGHWSWQSAGWVWVAGRWMRPRANHVWEAPVCVAVEDGSYQYHPGYWRPQASAPPVIYRTPGTIQVHARRPGASVVVQRVPPREATTTTVVVRPSRPTAPSSTVVVQARPTTTVQVRPNQPTTTTVQVRPTQPTTRPATVTVQARPTTVRPNTTVRPTTTRPTATVRPATTTVRPNTTVRPTVRPTTTRPTTTRPTTTARPATTRPNTTVRPTTTARPATTRPNTTVRPATRPALTQTRPAVMTARPNTNANPTCRPAVTMTTPGGNLVLRGSNLQGTTAVTFGGQPAPIVRSSATEIQARVGQSARGGTVRLTVNGRTISCGNVRVSGVGRPR